MTTVKPAMTGSYKLIFIFSIAMAFLTLLAGNKGGIGTIFWGYVAWMMHKRNNSGLVSLFKFSLWLVAFSFVIGFFLLGNGTFKQSWVGYSAEGYFLAIFLVGVIDFCLLNYFKNLTPQENSAQVTSPSSSQSSSKTRVPSEDLYTSKPYVVNQKNLVSETILTEEQIYLQINDELESGKTDKALWLRLFSELDGDENKTKAYYIKQRFIALKNRDEQSKTTAIAVTQETQEIPRAKISEYVSFYKVDEQTAAEMVKFKIWYQNDMYIYKTYRYEKLNDALAFARLEEPKSKSS